MYARSGFHPADRAWWNSRRNLRDDLGVEGENHKVMNGQNNSVARRTLIMAAVLAVGLAAAMFAKGMLSTTVVVS